jgi:putative component of membrane protein insertase Oxa1/YidC/SpoIIIJ protein YidD
VSGALLFLIRCYWRLVPATMRRSCIFNETCSHYVYRHVGTGGFVIGVVALIRRLRTCRYGFQIVELEGDVVVCAKDGTVLPRESLSSSLQAFCGRYATLEMELNGHASTSLVRHDQVRRVKP